MKLLYCTFCKDIIRLFEEERECKCGKVKGKYIDDLNAVYSGKTAMPLGINNFSFILATKNQPNEGMGRNFVAFVIPKICETFIKKRKL